MDNSKNTRLNNAGTESKTLGLAILNASNISSRLGQSAIAEPWAINAFNSAV